MPPSPQSLAAAFTKQTTRFWDIYADDERRRPH